MIQIKNAKELDGMRKANALSAAALKYGGEHIEAGMTTWELDKLIYDFIVKHGGIPNFKGLYGFRWLQRRQRLHLCSGQDRPGSSAPAGRHQGLSL